MTKLDLIKDNSKIFLDISDSDVLDDIYKNVCRFCSSSMDECKFFNICSDVLDYLEDK